VLAVRREGSVGIRQGRRLALPGKTGDETDGTDDETDGTGDETDGTGDGCQ